MASDIQLAVVYATRGSATSHETIILHQLPLDNFANRRWPRNEGRKEVVCSSQALPTPICACH